MTTSATSSVMALRSCRPANVRAARVAPAATARSCPTVAAPLHRLACTSRPQHLAGGLPLFIPPPLQRCVAHPGTTSNRGYSSSKSTSGPTDGDAGGPPSWTFARPRRPLSKDGVAARVIEVIKAFAGTSGRIDGDKVLADSTFLGDSRLDSLDVTTILLMVEDEFNIEFSEDDFSLLLDKRNLPAIVDKILGYPSAI
ncbi:hypothetical protein HK405_003114 [Cladochytrium tenue]|nr:hypothetical protein HK405_003114 [Cladochytrium tenue]